MLLIRLLVDESASAPKHVLRRADSNGRRGFNSRLLHHLPGWVNLSRVFLRTKPMKLIINLACELLAMLLCIILLILLLAH